MLSGAALSAPVMFPPAEATSTGVLFGPLGVLAVTPSLPRSIPGPPLPKMALNRTVFPIAPAAVATPGPELKAIRLPPPKTPVGSPTTLPVAFPAPTRTPLA